MNAGGDGPYGRPDDGPAAGKVRAGVQRSENSNTALRMGGDGCRRSEIRRFFANGSLWPVERREGRERFPEKFETISGACNSVGTEEYSMPLDMITLIVILSLPLAPTFWAILDIPKRRFATVRRKIVWFLFVSTFPFVGAMFYIILVRRHTEPIS